MIIEYIETADGNKHLSFDGNGIAVCGEDLLDAKPIADRKKQEVTCDHCQDVIKAASLHRQREAEYRIDSAASLRLSKLVRKLRGTG